jgi:two-component system, NtrC family, sensor kinase
MGGLYLRALRGEKLPERESAEKPNIIKTFDEIFPSGWAVFTPPRNVILQSRNEIDLYFIALSEMIQKSRRDDFCIKRANHQRYFMFRNLHWGKEVFFIGIFPSGFDYHDIFRNFYNGALFIIIAGIGGVSLVVYLTASKFVIRPMDNISEAASRISEGDYSKPVYVGKSFDEGQNLAESVNSMMGQLKEYKENMLAKIEAANKENMRQQKKLVLAQRLAATGKLAAAIAHEINNPLGGMLNAVSVLIKEQNAGPLKTKEYLLLMEDGLKRIKSTVGRILQFQRSSKTLRPLPVKLSVCLQKAVSFVDHRLQEKKIRLHQNEDLSMLPDVLGDENEMQQIFLNILMNAADAVSIGGNIYIEYAVDQKKVLLSIRDDGCGMTTEELSQVYDLFYTTKVGGEGTGLGLSIVHNLVKNHGGEIDIVSEKGKGSVVKLAFPVIDGSEIA